ncbi:MAG: hypothetical protein HKP36_13850 [Myxococcales bacterium]|nr:hypothetical protein [Deltaproteobacteria bacterium]NNL25523.1 hypothetical protein [Myxococcales bacterium]
MRDASTLLVAVLVSVSPSAKAQTRIASDAYTEPLCERARAELEQVGISATTLSVVGNTRRKRRRAFADTTVQALIVCRRKPARIEVFYPDGSRFGEPAFVVPASDEDPSALLYLSERIRAERFVADVPKPVPFTPAVWWLGFGGEVLLSPGGVAPLGLITLDVGYRFHRRWSVQAFASIQPYMRRLSTNSAESRLRIDQFGAAIAYHPVVTRRVDLSLGARVAAARLGANGTSNGANDDLESQRDRVWLASPTGRVSLRVGLTDRVWLRMQGEVGAIVPKAVVAAGAEPVAALGAFTAQAGLALEAHFR